MPVVQKRESEPVRVFSIRRAVWAVCTPEHGKILPVLRRKDGGQFTNEFTITLTRSQVKNLVEFFEFSFLNLIADLAKDEEIDNMDYLVDMCDIYKSLSELLKK